MNDFSTIVRSLFPALKPYTWAILGSLAITSLVIGTDLFQPYCLKLLLDAATLSRNYRLVVTLLLVLLGLAVLRSCISYWEGYARSRVGEAIAASYRQRLFAHVLQVPLATLQEAESGVLETRIMNDPGTIGRVYVATQLLPLVANLVQALALMGLLLALSWQVGLASLLVFPLGWLLTHQMTRRNHTHLWHLRSLVERGQGMVQEALAGIREIRVAGHEAGERRRWETWVLEYRQLACVSSTERQFVRVALGRLIEWVGLSVVFGWGGWQLLHQQLTIGALLAMSLYVQQFYTTLTAILGARMETSETAQALQAIQAILDLPQEDPDEGRDLGDEVRGHLAFSHVSFSYTGDREHLQQISFESMPGQVIGIAGPTGSGKSTLIDLCLRLYPVSQGAILLDGVDIAEVAPHALRRQIGLVSQDLHLWNTTIRANLLYGLPEEVSWERVQEICEQTCVAAFVQQLPQGYDTLVGSRGVKLSGGEKQRIALARALLRAPKILLLDEATSALDSLTESAITDTLLQTFPHTTRILVAHRLATLRGADQILVLDAGQIVEQGTPRTLLQQHGLYAALSRTQRVGTEQLPVE